MIPAVPDRATPRRKARHVPPTQRKTLQDRQETVRMVARVAMLRGLTLRPAPERCIDAFHPGDFPR